MTGAGFGRALSLSGKLAGDMSGYTPDEKLRLQQLRELRRRWLKDQELSPREPVLPPRRMWPLERFWDNFLRDGALWKNMVSDEPPRCPGSHPGSQPGQPTHSSQSHQDRTLSRTRTPGRATRVNQSRGSGLAETLSRR